MKFINVAIAVNDIEQAVSRFEEAFGWSLERPVDSQPGLGIRTAILKAGDAQVELISPLPGELVLRKYLDTHGEGVYRLAFGTDDVASLLNRFDEVAVRYTDLSGSISSDTGSRLVFTHPKSAHGVMLEFIENYAG